MRLRSRGARAILAGLAVVALVSGAWIATRPQSAEERARAADALVAGILASVKVDDDRLLAARAIADFGVGGEVRLVRVRIVDELRLDVRVDVTNELVSASPIVACLVGPDPAPDDAGLSDRCWGDADLGALFLQADKSAGNAGGRTPLAAGSRVITAVVHRGEAGCDYPPGTWRLELLVDPIVDGVAAGPRYAPAAAFEVPFDADEPLRLVEERRYCGLASKIYREQGEPPLLAP
jgi:hypothetical protein